MSSFIFYQKHLLKSAEQSKHCWVTLLIAARPCSEELCHWGWTDNTATTPYLTCTINYSLHAVFVALILRLYLFPFPLYFLPNLQILTVCCTHFFSKRECRPSFWQQEGCGVKEECRSSLCPAHSQQLKTVSKFVLLPCTDSNASDKPQPHRIHQELICCSVAETRAPARTAAKYENWRQT